MSIVKHCALPFTVRYAVTLKSENMLLLSMLLEDRPADTPVARPHPLREGLWWNNTAVEAGIVIQPLSTA